MKLKNKALISLLAFLFILLAPSVAYASEDINLLFLNFLDITTNNLNVTGNINLTLFKSCTALETDSSGNLVCGSDDGGGAGIDAWVNESGDVMTGDLNLTDPSQLKIGNVEINTNSKNNVWTRSLNIYSEVDPTNQLLFAIYGNGTTGTVMPHFWIQNGGPSSASGISRSFMIVNEIIDQQNTENITNCVTYQSEIMKVPESHRIDCATDSTGSDLLVSDDILIGGDMQLKDSEGEYHKLTRELEIRDEITDDLLFNEITTFFDNGDLVINDSSTKTLIVNIDKNNTDLNVTGDSITLNTGTNDAPVKNFVSYQNTSNPVLTIDSEHSSLPEHADVCSFGIGATTDDIFWGVCGGERAYEFMTRIIHHLFEMGLLYDNGFNVTGNSNTLIIENGTFDLVGDELTTVNNLTITKFYHILGNGTYVSCTDLSCIKLYSDGTAIGNNKRVNVVFGAVLVNQTSSRLIAIVQDFPGSGKEYKNANDAEKDQYLKLQVSPSDGDIQNVYLPIARVILDANNDDFEAFNNGRFFLDIRGSATGGGGSPPSTVTDIWVDEIGDIMSGDLNVSGTGFVNISDEGNLNMSGNLWVGGNYYNDNGEVIIWSNGTVEADGRFYSGVADNWLNTTGDDLRGNITVNLNKTYWLGNETEWLGNVYSDLFRGLTGAFNVVYISDNLLVLGNITGNLTASNVTLIDLGDFFDVGSENAESAIQELASSLGGQFLGNTSWLLPVISFLSDPPGAPNIGDRYIITGDDTWCNLNWDFRVEIEVNHKNVYKNMSYFPVKVQFPPGHSIFTNAKADGSDVVFCIDDGVTQQHVKIEAGEPELFDAVIGVFWLNMTMDETANRTLFGYYGYPGASEQYDLGNIALLWGKDFGNVFHMNSSKPGFTNIPFDSAFEGTTEDIPVTLAPPTETNDAEGYKQYWDGVNDFWSMNCVTPNCYWENDWNNGNRTHIIVFNTSEDITTRQFLGAEGGGTNGWGCYLELGNVTCVAWAKSNGFNGLWFTEYIEANHDNYVLTTVWRCDDTYGDETCETSAGDQYNNFTMYLNGTQRGTAEHLNALGDAVGMNAHSGGGGIGYTGINDKMLYGGGKSLGNAHFYEGIISEFIIADVIWDLETHQTFHDMMTNESFISIKAEESVGAGATGDFAGHEGNVTQFNESSDWHMLPSNHGDATYITLEMLIYAYDGPSNTWSVASDVSSHDNLLDCRGCDPDSNEGWHVLESEHTILTRPATDTEPGYMDSGLTNQISANTANRNVYVNTETFGEVRISDVSDPTAPLNLTLGGVTTGEFKGWQQAREGSITALAVNTDTFIPITGTCTFEVLLNGVGTGLTVDFSDTGIAQKGSTTQATGVDTFIADDIISVLAVETVNGCESVANSLATVELTYDE